MAAISSAHTVLFRLREGVSEAGSFRTSLGDTDAGKSGYREVVLTGIHLSSYGVDNGESLLHLIEAVHELEGIERIRLKPGTAYRDGRVCKRLSELPKICPHFHLSLQSGCDTVLSRMNRRYDTAEYEVVVRCCAGILNIRQSQRMSL